ncbi:MAG: HD domain-containing phosphohydrolase [Planctomycetota bacterium]
MEGKIGTIELKGKRALVVDDEETVLRFVTEALALDGLDVVACAGVSEAVNAAQHDEFDVLITDLRLTDGNGLNLVKRIQEIRPGTPSIIMTGFGTLENAREAMKEGVCDFVLKPFDREELLTSINNVLQRQVLSEENAALKRLAGLFEASKAISAIVDVLKLPHLVLGSALSQTDSARGFVLLMDGGGHQPKFASTVGWSDEDVEAAREKLAKHPVAEAAIQGKLMLISKDPAHPLAQVKTLERIEPTPADFVLPMGEGEELIMLPLKSHKRMLGALALTKNGKAAKFSRSDLQILTILARHSGVALENSQLFADLQESYVATFKSLVMLMEARDPSTHGHSQRVTMICDELTEDMGLPADRALTLHYAATLHDIGKFAISEFILNKKEVLNDEDWEQIYKHPEIAYRVLEPIRFLADAREIILRHHERGDGSGYPGGLTFKDLTLVDHILIVADMFDAMNADRAYRTHMRPDEIMEILEGESGSRLDPDVVTVLQKLFREQRLPARR